MRVSLGEILKYFLFWFFIWNGKVLHRGSISYRIKYYETSTGYQITKEAERIRLTSYLTGINFVSMFQKETSSELFYFDTLALFST